MANITTDPDSDFLAARQRFRERVELSRSRRSFRRAFIDCACEGCEHALPEVSGASIVADEVRVAGVMLKDSSRTYYFDPGNYSLEVGTKVLIQSNYGVELGEVVIAPHQMVSLSFDGELRPIIRPATESDVRLASSLETQQGEALRSFTSKIHEHNLPMKPLRASYDADGKRLTFYFSAPHRVDFRSLVRDLARQFGCRIELRQVGPRDAARFVGGLGRCGRPLCCTTWLTDFTDVSMTMARNQELSGNPAKLNGACGKLLCCLSFENDTYLETRSKLPRLGQEVETVLGSGYVKSLNILRETATVQLEDGESTELNVDQLIDQHAADTEGSRDSQSRVRKEHVDQ